MSDTASTAPRHLVFAISADYERRTGGWIYDQRLMEELRQRGWEVRDLILPAGFPRPDAEARMQSAAALDALADGTVVVIDQLCLGVMPDVAERQSRRLRLVMIVHHPLSLENDRGTDENAELARSERAALSHVALAIATSNTTARFLQEIFEVPKDRIVVAVPGVDRQTLAHGSGRPVSMLSVGAVVPRKDHGSLVTALAGLEHLDWHLTIVGNVTRAPVHVAEVQSLIREHGLSDRIRLAGELDDSALSQIWRATDLYVAASRHEGFGMALSEAIARAIPVVSTAAGAVPEWLSNSAALLVPPQDPEALRVALIRVLADADLRAALRRGAMEERLRLPRWEVAAAIVDTAIRRLIGA